MNLMYIPNFEQCLIAQRTLVYKQQLNNLEIIKKKEYMYI